MNLEFEINKELLAYYIIKRQMIDESQAIKSIKEKLQSSNKIAYDKINNIELIDLNLYLKDKDIQCLLDAFINNKNFKTLKTKLENNNDYCLAIKILNEMIPVNDQNITDIKNSLWNKYRTGYKNLQNFNNNVIENCLKDKDIKKLIHVFIKNEEFKNIYQESLIYMNKVKENWQVNQNFINNYLKNILRIDFNFNLTVYITHPNLHNGHNLGNNTIIWSHFRDLKDPYCGLTYLTHEVLHSLIEYHKDYTHDKNLIIHSTIELITDYELYSLLKNRSTIDEGHLGLKQCKNFLYLYWLQYIGLNKAEIIQRCKKDNINFDSNSFNVDKTISKLNIFEFIDYAYSEYIKK